MALHRCSLWGQAASGEEGKGGPRGLGLLCSYSSRSGVGELGGGSKKLCLIGNRKAVINLDLVVPV